MTIGEQLYLALMLLAFFTFAATLAVVFSRASHHMRRRATDQPAERDPPLLNKVA